MSAPALLPKASASPKSHPTHGYSQTPEYRAWQCARKRCTDPQNSRWADYGGRGITMCDRWLNDVAAFIADMGPKPSPRHELDREKNDRGYEPSNCRWIERRANNRNKRNNRIIEWRGETKTLMEWSEETGFAYCTLKYRLDSGWSAERAFTEPASLSPRRTATVHSPGAAAWAPTPHTRPPLWFRAGPASRAT